MHQDRSPLEPTPPKIDAELQDSAAKLFQGKMEQTEEPSDVYSAQLARSKAAKVDNAEKVLSRAVKKQAKKTTSAKGRGRGRGGRGKAAQAAAAQAEADENGDADDDQVETPAHDETGNKGGTADATDAAPADAQAGTLQAQWLEKEISKRSDCQYTP